MAKNSAMAHLIEAYDMFAVEARRSRDKKERKAALEDAAEVAGTIGAIENGLNRGKYDSRTLRDIFRGREA